MTYCFVTISERLSLKVLQLSESTSWLQVSPELLDQLPSSRREWLSYRGSLTKKLSKHIGSDIAVKVLRQEWQLPSPSEAHALHISKSESVLIREVLLCRDTEAIVYARTVIPERSFSLSFSFVDAIGDQPLGHWLFKTQGVERGPIMIRHERPFEVGGKVFEWGRRSVFSYMGYELLVAEYFERSFDL